MEKHIILAALAAILASGCRTKAPSMSPGAINATLTTSNHVGSAISDGNQINAMMDKDAVLAIYKDVAMTAAKAGTEMSLTAVGHGASKQPNVQRESKATEKLTNSLASAIKAAKSGGDPNALAKFGADLVGGLVELSEEAANPPAADDTSLLGFDLKVGPGANLAGIAVAKTMSDTRIETVKAARSTYSRVQTTDASESNTPGGIDAIAAAMVALEKLKQSPAPVAAPVPGIGDNAGRGDRPSPAVPPSSGADGAGDLSPSARLDAWYPSVLHTDKAGFTPDESGLWKPGVGSAENMKTSNGKLAIHAPHSKLGRVIKIVVDDEASGVGQTGNGGRPLFRFSKTGSAYSGNVTLYTDMGTWTAKAANPAARCGLDFKLATPESSLPPSVTPATPDPKQEDATAPGEPVAP